MSDYNDELRNPKWQRLRLEKMQASDFKCELCGDGEETLNVHHKRYLKDALGNRLKPWDYPLSELQCLCETCHSLSHLSIEKVRRFCEAKPKIVYHVDQADEALDGWISRNFSRLNLPLFESLLELSRTFRLESRAWKANRNQRVDALFKQFPAPASQTKTQ